MKLRIILSAILVIFLSVGFNPKAVANPYGYYRHGYCRPVVRYCPPVRVYVPPVVVGGYYGPHYYAPVYCGHNRGYYRR